MKKIYLAGPDVFEPNAIKLGQEYVKTCKKFGFDALFPLDNVVNFNQEKKDIAKEIYEKNCQLIDKADIVIANLNAFRGKEADSGTIWECGYAHAKGKEVYGYMQNCNSYVNKFSNDEKTLIDDRYFDNEGKEIENFDLCINLMIGCSCKKIVQGNLEAVLAFLTQRNDI